MGEMEVDSTDRNRTDFFLFDVDGTLTKLRGVVTQDMLDFMKEVRKKVYCGVVAGAEFDEVNMKLNAKAHEIVDYVFSENGLNVHKHGKPYKQMNMALYLGEEKLQEIIAFSLRYIADLDLPFKRGQFISVKNGLINVCPMGRNCSEEDRERFCRFDQEHHVREKFIVALSERFTGSGLKFTRGGQTSLDIYPKGWSKQYCLDTIDDEGFEDIHFFGDRCEPGGTDYDIYKDPRVTGFKVTGPDDLRKKLEEVLFKGKIPPDTMKK